MCSSRVTQTRRMKSCLSSGWQGKGFSHSLKPFRLPRKLQHQPHSRGMLHVEHQGFSQMLKSAILSVARRHQDLLMCGSRLPRLSWLILLLLKYIGISKVACSFHVAALFILKAAKLLSHVMGCTAGKTAAAATR